MLDFRRLLATKHVRVLAFAAISAPVVAWTGWILTRPQWQAYSYLYDDAFYYLIPAHSFAHGQGWTFDGINPTSGFHPLYAYGAAAVSVVTGYSSALPAVMTISSAAALLVGVWLFLGHSGRLYGAGTAAIGIAATLAAPKAFLQITSGLEWAWAVMATMILVTALIGRHTSLWSVPIASCLAVLARIDLAIFVAIFTVAMAISRLLDDRGQPLMAMRQVALGGLGAVAGVVITAVISRRSTGSWISNAVLVKESWARTNEFLPAVAWDFIMAATGPGALFTTARAAMSLRSILTIGTFFLVAVCVCAYEWRKGPERRALAVASVTAIAAYSVAYARGINFIFEHYSAPIVVPVALLTCGALAACGRFRVPVAVGLAVGLSIVCARGSWSGIAQNAAIARDAATLHATLPAGSRVGAWSAGIAGWQTRRGVINLDGLANANVARHVRSGTLACYLADAEVTHLMDFELMFPGAADADVSHEMNEYRKLIRQRLGYDSRELYSCIDRHATAPLDESIGWRYAVFEIRRGCVENLCRKR
jgi:hypothetical protein